MNLAIEQLETRVASVEERALQLSLMGYGCVEKDELVEAQDNITRLELALSQFGNDARHLVKRLESARAELEVISLWNQDKAGLTSAA